MSGVHARVAMCHRRRPSRLSEEQNATNEPKQIRWLEMHKLRPES
jgi:hypothetical protein